MKRKIAVVTATRAEFGLLYWIVKEINDSPELQLQLIVTGTHLSPEFGTTRQEIEEANFPIARCVESLLSSDSALGVCKSTGLGLIGMADAFHELKPDILVLLGDRFELLSAAAAALLQNIPIAHIHGGEITEGAVDDGVRHSVTKMSHLHFTSTSSHRRRVIQMGECPDRVFNFGAPGLENITRSRLLERDELENKLGHPVSRSTLLITYHPVTTEPGSSTEQLEALFRALEDWEEEMDPHSIFTMPNADAEGRALGRKIEGFCAKRPTRRHFHTSLGRLNYLSAMKHVGAVVGNSSSGIIEAPSFKIPTINIGNRQRGRSSGGSVIHCRPDSESVLKSLRRAFSVEFQDSVATSESPYGKGDVASKIVNILSNFPLSDLNRKTFYDLPVEELK